MLMVLTVLTVLTVLVLTVHPIAPSALLSTTPVRKAGGLASSACPMSLDHHVALAKVFVNYVLNRVKAEAVW